MNLIQIKSTLEEYQIKSRIITDRKAAKVTVKVDKSALEFVKNYFSKFEFPVEVKILPLSILDRLSLWIRKEHFRVELR